MNILEKIDKFTEEEYTTEKIDYTKPAGRKKLVKNLVNKNASFLKNLSNELFDKIDRKAESEVSKEGISDRFMMNYRKKWVTLFTNTYLNRSTVWEN